MFNGTAGVVEAHDRPVLHRLSRVICFYSDAHDERVAMQHRVGADGKLGPGKAFDPIGLAMSLYRLKKGELVDRLVLIGDGVLAENQDAMLWWRPPSVDKLWFKTAEPVPELTALNGVPLPQPGLLFKVIKKSGNLLVWATLGDRRPSSETPLYHAPYMNLAATGHVCLGSAKAREIARDQKATPKDWEKLFFDSNFSHTPPPLHHATLRSTPPPSGTIDERKEKLAQYASFLDTLRRIPPGRKADLEAAFAKGLVRWKDKKLASIL